MSHWRSIALLASAVAIAIAARHVDWHAAIRVLGTASPSFVLAAVTVNGCSLVLRGGRWWIFLRAAGATSLGIAVRGAIVGAGFNNLLIANGGDAARAVLVSRESRVAATPVLATLALDRAFDPLCFVLLLFVATFTAPLPPAFRGAREIAAAAILVAVIGLAVLARGRTQEAGACSARGWRRFVAAFACQLRWLASGRRFAAALACSIAIWFLQLLEYAAVARALGIDLPFAGSVAAMVLINAGLVVRSTPGGIGYFQLAYAIAVSPFGIPTETAVATSLLIQLVEIVPVTVAAVGLAPRMVRPRATPG